MKKEKTLRYGILLFFLILYIIFSFRHFILGGGIAASIDALCPFGGFETLYTFISTGSMVPGILMSSLILAIGILISVIILKRGFCGYICPFGTVQELIGKITKKKIAIAEKTDRYLRYLKYLILIAILIATAYTGTLIFRGYDPFATFFHFGKGLIWDYEQGHLTANLIAAGITIAILAAAIFIDRFWCRYLCPLAATMNIFTKFGSTNIWRNKDKCISCRLCDRTCPMKVAISDKKRVTSAECINCNQCVSVCPKSALEIKIFNKKISPLTYAILILALIFSVILVAKLIGVWQSIPDIKADTAGNLNPDYIKGWMTLEQISKESKIPLETIIKDLNLPKDLPAETAIKDIKNYAPGFETEIIRTYLENYQSRQANSGSDCPWGTVNCSYPGDCGLYTDDNSNKICDYSE
ncbi:MAG: 4Fe-4S binding protein [Nanoarchaeota archaeon]|nr:4Fe-4S binding protein [Nanoarchaeota archaeon]